ncbi:MAG TPA: DUF4230 domain-containing protein [Hanamia sp.]|nr:DUF4230 domain-containing protein [Hanamia sp.]
MPTICVFVNCMMRIFIIILFSLSLSAINCSSKKEPSKMQQVLGLQTMSDLATAEYVVTKIIKANDNKTWYKVGNRKILMSCKASLVAGIDLSKLTEKDIQIDGETISITLPRAKLLYINIKPEDIKTAYQDVSLFRTNFSAQEKDELAAQAEKQIKSSLDSLGIFVTAETNASLFINNFLQKTGFKNININFSPVNNRLQ